MVNKHTTKITGEIYDKAKSNSSTANSKPLRGTYGGNWQQNWRLSSAAVRNDGPEQEALQVINCRLQDFFFFFQKMRIDHLFNAHCHFGFSFHNK